MSKWSAEQDRTGDERLIGKMRAVSAPGLVVFTLTTTFAFIDWIMSLEPHWFSTIYGAMFMVGEMLESFAFVIALVIVLSQDVSDQGLRDATASSRPGQHDVCVHGFVGVPIVFAIPHHLVGQSAGGDSLVSAPAARRLGMGGADDRDLPLRHSVCCCCCCAASSAARIAYSASAC